MPRMSAGPHAKLVQSSFQPRAVWFPQAQDTRTSQQDILPSYKGEIPLNNVKHITYLAIRKKIYYLICYKVAI